MNPDEFDLLSVDEKIAFGQNWQEAVRPALIDKALEQGTLPSIIEYHESGGPAHFSFFENVDRSETMYLDAIERHLTNLPAYDLGPLFRPWLARNELLKIDPVRLSRGDFYGHCIDVDTGKLRIASQPLEPIPGLVSATFSYCPEEEPGNTRGEFVYAFALPPHRPRLSAERLQSIFDEIDAKIFANDPNAEILDWADPNLINVSNYFVDGFEYWGAFLFSVYVPSKSQLSIISASATD